MRAVVLVGGFGTRLQPLTFTTPKQLLPVGQRPMLDHVVGHLAAHGITDAVLSIGFKPDAFFEAYPSGSCAGVSLHYAVEPEPLDTAGAIRFAARYAGIDETFVVVNGDVLTDLDVGALIEFHRSSGGSAAIHLTPVADPSAFGVVPTDGDGRVIAFLEKPPPGEAPTNLINAGTYVLEPSVLDRIPPDRRVSIERETFPMLVAEGGLYALATDDYWLDAGRPDLYLQANLDAIAGVRARAQPEAAHGEGATVAPDATVQDSVVGAGATVAGGAVVERSVVMARAVVGAGAHVADSVVGVGARIGAGAAMAGTIVGDDVSVPAGAVLTDARVPEPA